MQKRIREINESSRKQDVNAMQEKDEKGQRTRTMAGSSAIVKIEQRDAKAVYVGGYPPRMRRNPGIRYRFGADSGTQRHL